MTTRDYTALDRAICAVGAIRLPDGDYAYYDNAVNRYYIVDESDLADIPTYQDDPDEDAARDWYSQWCAGTMGREAPYGWTPDMREGTYLIEYVDGGDCCADCCAAIERLAPDHSIVTREERDRIDDAVGACVYHCVPSSSHRWYDHCAELLA